MLLSSLFSLLLLSFCSISFSKLCRYPSQSSAIALSYKKIQRLGILSLFLVFFLYLNSSYVLIVNHTKLWSLPETKHISSISLCLAHIRNSLDIHMWSILVLLLPFDHVNFLVLGLQYRKLSTKPSFSTLFVKGSFLIVCFGSWFAVSNSGSKILLKSPPIIKCKFALAVAMSFISSL